MGSLDPVTRRATRLGLDLAGGLIDAVRRRGAAGSRRTPDRLLLEDASGMPGPALVGPVADFDGLLVPDEVEPIQARELMVEAGKIAVGGVVRRLQDTVRELLAADSQGLDQAAGADGGNAPARAEEPAERAAWERFLGALEKVTDLRAAYAVDPDELAAEDLRWAEVELEDAVAVAGEFEVKKIRWLLA